MKTTGRSAMWILAAAIAGTAAVHANPSGSVVRVTPADLPDSAREGGEALLLHKSLDGRTLLYVEQNQGARLTAFDVTDPAHVSSAGSVELDAAGPFDFVSALGDRAELVRYRDGRGDAVLDLRNVPALKPAEVPAADSVSPDRGIEQDRRQMTNSDTGTTFVLAADGLHLIRRPAVERVHQLMVISPN